MPLYKHKLVMYDNDVYDFGTIIDSISFVCNMHSMAAEQIATITNDKGSCVIKEGSKVKLTKLQKELREVLPHLDTEIVKED